ncbi:hypothetical protein [Kitasatospora sp. NPDC056184]|uniref:hypothetical protein n=1 Tax=Kitasatospora sp. NPDC056184 TaxID=3345738 RepID=UPI0035D69223
MHQLTPDHLYTAVFARITETGHEPAWNTGTARCLEEIGVDPTTWMVLDSQPVHGSTGLRWTGCDVDGPDGWVALVDGRVVLGARPGFAVPEPVVHTEAWQAGALLRAALARHPNNRPGHAQDEHDVDQEHGLLGSIRRTVPTG